MKKNLVTNWTCVALGQHTLSSGANSEVGRGGAPPGSAGLAVRKNSNNRNRNSHSRYSGEPGLNAEELPIRGSSSTTLVLATHRCRVSFKTSYPGGVSS